ncbi:MAG TPA: hypothetical protein DEO82_05200 [Eubacterium sp.]|nr:hypothetical protein [Eubacterium sp.]
MDIHQLNKKRSKGSTMVMAIVAVAFVSIIATVCLLAAGTNAMLKGQNLRNKKNFYSSESIVEELYSGIGMTSMNSLSESYKYTLSKKMEPENTGSIYTGKMSAISNDKANAIFRKKFIVDVASNIVGNSSSTGAPIYTETTGSVIYTVAEGLAGNETHKDACDNALKYLNNLIKDHSCAHVVSLSAVEITAYDPSESKDATTGKYNYQYKVVLKDVDVEYLQTSNDYFSELTLDYNIELPYLDIVFNVDATKLPDAFKDYIFISTTGVTFKTMNGIVTGGVYAGNTNPGTMVSGIIVDNSDVTFRSEKGTVTSSKDLKIVNNAYGKAAAKFEGSDIWAVNLVLDTTNTKKPEGNNVFLNIDGNSRTHLSDDLQFQARYSTANISGDYWGYGTGPGSGAGEGHMNFSAINMNGKNSTLNINNAKHLLIAGKAYLMYNPGESAPTSDNLLLPESLGMMGNQRYYVVPDKYLKVTWDGMDEEVAAAGGVVPSQPINIDVSPNPVYTLSDDFKTSFFGYRYLNPGEPYVVKKGNGKYQYCVLNFASNLDANNYLRCLLDVGYYNAQFGAEADAYRLSRNDMAAMTISFLNNVNSIVNVNSPSASIAAAGLIINYASLGSISSGGENTPDIESQLGGSFVAGTESPVFITKMEENFINKSNILHHTLIKDPEYDSTGKINVQLKDKPTSIDLFDFTITLDMYTHNVFENYIDTDELEAAEYFTKASAGSFTAAPKADGEFVYIGKSDITVPATAKYGVIVTEGTVTFESGSDFYGLVMAQKSIYVNSSANYSNHIHDANGAYEDIVAYINESNDGELVKYFKTLKGAFNAGEETADDKLSKLKYLDLVTYSNWRKTVGEDYE